MSARLVHSLAHGMCLARSQPNYIFLTEKGQGQDRQSINRPPDSIIRATTCTCTVDCEIFSGRNFHL